jgi:hypothetical protein
MRWLTVCLAAGVLCAPALAEAQSAPTTRYVGKWQIDENLPAASGRKACAARASGERADTLLMLNSVGSLILAAGHADWTDLSGPAIVSISIDGEAPTPLNAVMKNNLVLTLVTDTTILDRLRRARTMDWVLPSGRYHVTVTGLGKALDAIEACRQTAGASAPSP